MGRRSPRIAALAAALALAVAPAALAQEPLRDVVLVANGEGGTVSVVDAASFEVVRTIDVVPDGRRVTPDRDPVQALAQPIVEAAGGENYVQDLDVAPDGRTLYASRGHLADVAAFDLTTGALIWRLPVGGLRADHMTISPDGARLYVSALNDDRVRVVDTAARRIVGEVATGQWPHDNHLSHDGALLYNGSIGNIVLPPEARELAGDPYRLTVADARTLEVRRSYSFERGIRPFVVVDDEQLVYAQLSLFHGLVEFDLASGATLRTLELPVDAGVTEDDWDFEAPHHGLALAPDGDTLCVAGRASDYVALVSRAAMQATAVIDVPDAPSWAETTTDGEHCVVASTRANTVSAISYAERREVARVAVGQGPKYLLAARVALP